jgi:hypothetical protein
MSFEQARAICGPRAQAASNQAQAQTRAARTGEPNMSPYAVSALAAEAAQQAGNAMYSGCLAENGWRLERRCVANCR